MHYTNMTGKESYKISVTEFEIEEFKTIRPCPGKHAPFRTSCNKEKGILTTYLSLSDCKQ